MLQIGDIEIHLINDVTSKVDAGGAFGLVPRRLYEKYKQPDADNLIPMSQTCLLVRSSGKIIVVDTGLGTKLNEGQLNYWHITQTGGLLRGLAHPGVTPEDVDLVINTHLHADHCGGNTRWHDEESEMVVATFPNAEYVVQRREYEDAMQPNERTRATYQPYNYAPLVEAGQMRLLDGDTELAPGITGMLTPGHTPGHMSVRFESQGEHAAFVCDLATYAVHFERLAWMTAYDLEPLVTMATKRVWREWALETGAVLVFPHDTDRPAGRLTKTERGWTILETVDVPLLSV